MNRLLLALVLVAAQGAALTPAPAQGAHIAVTIEPAGQMRAPANPTSPIAAGNALILIDQAGTLSRWDGTSAQPLLSIKPAPAGLQPVGSEAIVNAAVSNAGTTLFVVFMSSAVPRGIPSRRSTRPGADAWQVFYRYDFDGTALSNPRPITALQVRTDGHSGGGLAVLADDTLLFATGDNGDAGEDGRAWAQDPTSHLGKILRIDPRDGSVTVAAIGVRNVQRLTVGAREGESYLDFIDMGGNIAEEFNSIRVTDLLRGGEGINFGWGRNAKDGKAREGTFYIDPGGASQGAASNDAGFRLPVAQVGREDRKQFGASGPVSSDKSFRRISALFGDLVSGDVFAITGSRRDVGQPVSRVDLIDRDGKPVSLLQLNGGQRADPRFFSFPDGGAGVLLEKTGQFFRLTERDRDSAQSSIPRDGYFDSNGVRLHYVEQGSGPAVVLIHELDGSIQSWMDSGVFADLATSFRVIAVDVRGHGLSAKPHEPAQYGVEMARDIVRLMDQLSIPKAHVVGYSLGSEIVAMLIASNPDRVLSATMAAGTGRLRKRDTDDQHMEEEALEYLSVGVSPKLFLEEAPQGTPDPTDEQLRKLAAIALGDPGRDRQALAALSRARPSRQVPPEKIAATSMPILGLAGSLDPELPEFDALRKLRAGVTMKVIDGATHSGPGRAMDQKEFREALKAFLKAS